MVIHNLEINFLPCVTLSFPLPVIGRLKQRRTEYLPIIGKSGVRDLLNQDLVDIQYLYGLLLCWRPLIVDVSARPTLAFPWDQKHGNLERVHDQLKAPTFNSETSGTKKDSRHFDILHAITLQTGANVLSQIVNQNQIYKGRTAYG